MKPIHADLLMLVVQLVNTIITSKDPKDAALRALQEAGRKRAFDEVMKRR